MLHIVGGTYLEHCLEPARNELFGSGGRAASALQFLNGEVRFTTYIGKNEIAALSVLAGTFNIHLKKIEIPQTVSFYYHHCLSDPSIYPAVSMIEKSDPITITDKNILRFGFLEGDAIVHGERVVYDPQNAFNPRLFCENGSTAKELAVVANVNECRKLTGGLHSWYEAEELGRKLLKKEQAQVVVVKQGSLGATVITETETFNIPAYKTTNVWSIGSGDIFAAVFAHFWASVRINPIEAAQLASLATAHYCNAYTEAFPVPKNFQEIAKYEPINRRNNFPQDAKQVYLAGPFFTMGERWVIDQARNHLTGQGFNVFSPLHDVGYGEAEDVAPVDIEALRESDVVFAILDGLDAGTIFEIGYARSLNKPVIAFVQNEGEENLKMIKGTDCEIVNDFVSAIYRTVWAAMET